MKKLFSLIALTLIFFVAPAQLSRNHITKTFTFTSSSQTTTYTANHVINQYTASATIYSVDIGVPYTSLVGLDIATSHTGTPEMKVALFNGTVTMPGDNTGTPTLTPTQLTNTFVSVVPISTVASISGGTAAATYSASSIPAQTSFSGSKLYFFIQNTAAAGTANGSAQYFVRFTLRKD